MRFGVSARFVCAGCCAVCQCRFACCAICRRGVFCRSRLVSLMLLRAALLSAAENRVTDREKEESCGL